MRDQPRRQAPPPSPFWTMIGYAAPVFVLVGCIGAVVGLLTGQALGIVLADVMTAVLGAILLLIVRWRC